MPAINVARTDTFEVQRVKINQLGNQIFDITQGGSDLATGNLKLGDGDRIAPSLAFTSDNSLGIYKADSSTIGYVSSGKKLADFGSTGNIFYKDFLIQRKTLISSGLSILNNGSNYDAGSYSDIPLVGGSGDGSTISIDVSAYTGSITDAGSNYNPGSYSGILLTGGNGTGSTVNFSVDTIEGNITNEGSGYIANVYQNISLTGGSGSGATANLTIIGAPTYVGSITNGGSGYTQGTYTNIPVYNVPRQTFTVTVIPNGSPPPGNIYQIDGVSQQSLTLEKGNTYRFDTSDSSISGHPFSLQSSGGGTLPEQYYRTLTVGITGTSGSYTDLIILPDAPSEVIEYRCLIHSGMGSTASVVVGTEGNYGSSASADVEVDSNGNVINFLFSTPGNGYKINDTVEVPSFNIGGTGSGFEFTITSITYNGVITNVLILDEGQNYLIDDVLSANTSDLGGVGSGFQFTITSNPGKVTNLNFTTKGTGYTVSDILELPTGSSNVSTVLKGLVTGLTSTLDSASTTITVSSTSGIVEGMEVSNVGGSDVGAITLGTTVASVDSSTTLTLSQNPTTSGSAEILFRSSGNLIDISVSSTNGIAFGYKVEKVSGSGILVSGTTVSAVDSNTNTITLSSLPDLAGNVVLNFIPTVGIGSTPFQYTVGNVGEIESFSISSGGNGYSLLDQLSVNPFDLTQPVIYNVSNKNLQLITLSSPISDGTFSIGDKIKKIDGSIIGFSTTSTPQVSPTVISSVGTTVDLNDASTTVTLSSTTGIVQGMFVAADAGSVGDINPGTTVESVDSATEITLSEVPRSSGSANLSFTSDESGSFTGVSSTSSGSGLLATFDIVRSANGSVNNVAVNEGGKNYSSSETITISGSDIGGTSPTDDITLSVASVFESPSLEIYKINSSGGLIQSMLIDFGNFVDGNYFTPFGAITPETEISIAGNLEYRFFIDTGSGSQISPDLTLYAGSTYTFDYSDSSNNGHSFQLSKFRDGIWSPSYIQNVSTTLDTNLYTITVSDTTDILPGMQVSVSSGDGGLSINTFVESIDSSTQITLDTLPTISGSAILSFRGIEYTNGVSKTNTSLSIRIIEQTPTLYYFCATNDTSHQNEGGIDLQESTITIDLNNPKTFGSNFSLSVSQLNSLDVISGNIETGAFDSVSISTTDASITNATISGILTANNISGNAISLSQISSSNNQIAINSTDVSFNGNISVGTTITANLDGNITTSGVLKTTDTLNVNDKLLLTENVVSSTTGNDILLTPATGRVAKVNTTTALIIPAGTSAERPTGGIVANGAVRFNIDNGQYEGYNASTTSWSSLGGVRDLDGNTYIEAESSVGANDNTLYLYNDGNNTISVTPNYLQFVDVKKIRSINTTAPAYTEYATNTNVTLGDYLKYRNNIYEVTQTGQTATSGNEPSHTTGAVSNGTAELTWHSTAVSSLIFEEIDEIKIDPLGFTDLVVNGELRFSDNVISTDLQDLIVRPNTGKKVTVDSNTSLVLPVGNTNQRGVATQGSVRFNTSNTTYEGYDGNNWGSLGGVKDVDQNTYIIPELSAGSDENILYFYNNGTNTMRLSEAALDFTNIDTITSQNNNLDFQAQTVTFNSLAATIDTSGNSTFISTTKDNLDLGLAVGINVDPLLRLDTNGDIYVNKAFGTGSFDGLKLISSSFDSFELIDYRINTQDIQLIKGGTNAGAATLYNPTDDTGSRVTVSIHNQTSGDKEMIEYHVIDKGSDIHHTDISNLNTGTNLVTSVFDFDAQNNIRVTFTLTDLTIGDVVNITVVSNTFKK